MSKQIKRKYDKLSTTKDIIERETIIRQFQDTGFLDRNDAIEKIASLQNTDVELALATKIKQAESGCVDLYQVDNNLIIMNMQFQVNFLKARLTKMGLEE